MRVSNFDIDRIYINGITRGSDYNMSKNHFHEYYEILYIKTGSCRFFVSNELYDLNSGDFMIVPPHEVHGNRYLTQSYRYNLYFKAEDLWEDLYRKIYDKYLKSTCFIHIPGTFRADAEALLSKMLSNDKTDDEYSKEILKNYLAIFFMNLCRYSIEPSTYGKVGQNDNPEILAAARYITDNFNQDITLNQMADMAGLSPSYFSRKFRNVTGMGMKEYLGFLRLKHASRLLVSTSLSITEIALQSGFSDSNYFKDAFKNMFGESPRSFRKAVTTDSMMSESIKKAASRHKLALDTDYSTLTQEGLNELSAPGPKEPASLNRTPSIG